MFSSLEIWDIVVAGLLAIAGFFIPFAPHIPHSPKARVLFVAVPLGLLLISQYLWATTGRGLIEHATCFLLPQSASCKPLNSPQSASLPETQSPPQQDLPTTAPPLSSEPSPTTATPQPSTGEPQATSPPPASSNNAPQPEETIRPAPGSSDIVRLTENNTKDIWSTSVYSYAPGGSTPGGGLANDRLRVGGWGDLYVALIQFDLPDVSCTSKVVLELYNSSDSPAPTPMYLNVITAPWDWQRGDRLWWRDLPASTPWEGQVIPAPSPNARLSIDISDLFAKWCRKEMPNYGIMLKPELNNNNYDAFYSTRYAGSDDLTPRLVISN